MAARTAASALAKTTRLTPGLVTRPARIPGPAAAQAAAVVLPSRKPQATGKPAVVNSLFGSAQVRHAHVQVPDFSAYKRPSKVKNEEDGDMSRRAFTYTLAAGGAIVGVHAAKNMVQDFLATMSASADVLALAKIEVDLSKIPEGKNICLKWQGKPLFVRHRPQHEIDEVRKVPVDSLPHKESDESRTQDPKWLVVLGICTHLGCVPLANAGDFGGYFCPCHGSHYDASGRIRKGPAPLNLNVPPYMFAEDGAKLVVG